MYKRPAGRFFILVDGPHFVPHRDTVRLSFVNKPHTQPGPCPFESCAALAMRGAHVPAAPELCGAHSPAGVPPARSAPPQSPYTPPPLFRRVLLYPVSKYELPFFIPTQKALPWERFCILIGLPALFAFLSRLDLFDHLGHYLEQVPYDAIIGHRKDGSTVILVHGNNGLRILHTGYMLNGAGNAQSYI